MSNFNNFWRNQEPKNQEPKAQETKSTELPRHYIHKDTRAQFENDATLKEIANGLNDKAKELIEKMESSGINLEEVNKDGKIQPSKAIVTVEKQTAEDGKDYYKANITMKNRYSDKLVLWGSNKQYGEIANITASKWNKNENRTQVFKRDEIANAFIGKDIKAVAKLIEDENLIISKDSNKEQSFLRNFAFEANSNFSDTDRVFNKEGDEVKNLYASYEKDNYGERVTIRAHQVEDKKTKAYVESTVDAVLFIDKEGNPGAKLVDWSLTPVEKDGKIIAVPKTAKEQKPYEAFVNSPQTLLKAIENTTLHPEVADAVAAFKGFVAKSQSKDKPQVEYND